MHRYEAGVMGQSLMHVIVQGNIDAFICPSCFAKSQQCFKCKEHGTADQSQPDRQQVFRCTGEHVTQHLWNAWVIA